MYVISALLNSKGFCRIIWQKMIRQNTLALRPQLAFNFVALGPRANYTD
jgi:hypothetical protein